VSERQPIQFYSSKPRLLHVAANIALAPALLYLVGLWPWPPTLPHYITLGITGLIAMRYAKLRWHQPRVQTVMRAFKLTLMHDDGRVSQKVLNLGWASNDDYKKIIALVTENFQRQSGKT
jgi:hypothetical protein